MDGTRGAKAKNIPEVTYWGNEPQLFDGAQRALLPPPPREGSGELAPYGLGRGLCTGSPPIPSAFSVCPAVLRGRGNQTPHSSRPSADQQACATGTVGSALHCVGRPMVALVVVILDLWICGW